MESQARLEKLFDFQNDYREINYQLKIPSQLFRNGSPHKMDLMTLRLLSYVVFIGSLFAMCCIPIVIRATLLIELDNCHRSVETFSHQRIIC